MHFANMGKIKMTFVDNIVCHHNAIIVFSFCTKNVNLTWNKIIIET